VIKEHVILGNKQNSFHDLVFTQEGNMINISTGSYWKNNEPLFQSNEPMTVEIQAQTDDMMYEIWITSGGILLFSAATNAPIEYEFHGFEPIDRLSWFFISVGTSLNDVEINVIKIVEE
jgi:hypothetical protein